MTPGPPAAPFARALLAWYDQERRDLPWRRAPSAYGTLVSELMLQQTVVATVVPYYVRFLDRFTTLGTLAAAREDEVLALWSGLGYYARARNLHRTAVQCVERHGGALPSSEAQLRCLPGIGEYTAAAIAAIAFGVRTFALDGNAARVMARLHDERGVVDRPVTRRALRQAGEALVPRARPGDFAQAVMELGARICVPDAPRCPVCPVARFCAALVVGTAAALPARSPRRPKSVVALTCVATFHGGRVLLLRRPARTLLGGTWTLPSVEGAGSEGTAEACGRALAQVGLRPVGAARRAGLIRHLFTHRDVTAMVVLSDAAGEATADARWVDPGDLSALALSSFTRKTLVVATRRGGSARRARLAPRATPD